MSRIAVTGANGFIGTHLVRHLEKHGHQVFPLSRSNCDLADLAQLQKQMNEIEPRFVFHLAAYVQPGRPTLELGDFFNNEVQMAAHLAQAIPLSTEMSFFFGSCEEYGNGPVPFSESQLPVCFSPYGWAKIASHHAVSFIAQERGLNWCWIRNFLTFGEGQKNSLLIPSVIAKCLRNEDIPLTGGEQTRDFIYIDDLIAMLLRLLENPQLAQGQILNLCSGQERTVRSVVELICQQIGRGKPFFGALPHRSHEAMRFYGNPQKFQSLYGKIKETDFAEAIQRTITAFKT